MRRLPILPERHRRNQQSVPRRSTWYDLCSRRRYSSSLCLTMFCGFRFSSPPHPWLAVARRRSDHDGRETVVSLSAFSLSLLQVYRNKPTMNTCGFRQSQVFTVFLFQGHLPHQNLHDFLSFVLGQHIPRQTIWPAAQTIFHAAHLRPDLGIQTPKQQFQFRDRHFWLFPATPS